MDRLTELERRLEWAARRHWIYELERFGPEEWPLFRLRVPTRGRELFRVVLAAGIHGDEPAGVEALLRLIEQQGFGPNLAVECYPCLNPEGYLRGTREDAAGRDLNREFGTADPPPAVAAFQERFGDAWVDVYADFHEDVGTRGFYMLKVADAPALAPAVLRSVEQAGFELEPGPTLEQVLRDDGLSYGDRPAMNGLKVSRRAALPDTAMAQGMYMAAHAEHVLTFESPSRDDFEDRVRMHLTAASALFRELRRLREPQWPNEFRAAEGRRR